MTRGGLDHDPAGSGKTDTSPVELALGRNIAQAEGYVTVTARHPADDIGTLPARTVSGAFGAVKEQSACPYVKMGLFPVDRFEQFFRDNLG